MLLKKFFYVILALLLVSFAACLETAGAGEREIAKKACFITTTPLGNEFTDLIWSGFKKLEQ